jgi:hypothetical protein
VLWLAKNKDKYESRPINTQGTGVEDTIAKMVAQLEKKKILYPKLYDENGQPLPMSLD